MSSHHLALVSLLATMFASAAANDLSLQQPSNHQVIQRSSREQGSVTIVGKLSERLPSGDLLIQARFLGDQQKDAAWLRVDGTVIGRELKGTLLAPAGGWWRMELRVSVDSQELARQEVPTSESANSLSSRVNPIQPIMAKRNKAPSRGWSPRSTAKAGDWPRIRSPAPAATEAVSCLRWAMRLPLRKKSRLVSSLVRDRRDKRPRVAPQGCEFPQSHYHRKPHRKAGRWNMGQ